MEEGEELTPEGCILATLHAAWLAYPIPPKQTQNTISACSNIKIINRCFIYLFMLHLQHPMLIQSITVAHIRTSRAHWQHMAGVWLKIIHSREPSR